MPKNCAVCVVEFGILLQVCIPTIPFSAAWLAGATFLGMPPALNFFVATFIFLVCMSQQFHAWSHMKKSQLSAPVVALQVSSTVLGVVFCKA